MRICHFCFVLLIVLVFSLCAQGAGSIFLTGHDPDFHAYVGTNYSGARNLITTAVGYVRDGAYNPYVTGSSKFLFVESLLTPPSGHVQGLNGLLASGYVQGVDFDLCDAATLQAGFDQLGTTYDAIVVASDFGGNLRQAELDILNARSSDIIDFLNGGGGLFAMAEGNNGQGLTPGGGHFGYLPFVVSSTNFNVFETGNTLTTFGANLGLTTNDINGNYSHNIFDGTFGLNIVDQTASGYILSLAGRGTVTPGGINTVPAPGAVLLGTLGVGLVGWIRKRKTL